MLGSMVLPISSVRPEGTRFFRSASKNEKQKEGKVPLRTITFGDRVTPVIQQSAGRSWY
jgi:hypothetical protein